MSVWDEARKLAEKLKSQARSSAVYNKLDQDKSRAGLQVFKPTSNVARTIQSVKQDPGQLWIGRELKNQFAQMKPQDVYRNTAQTFKNVARTSNKPAVKTGASFLGTMSENYSTGFKNIAEGYKNRDLAKLGTGAWKVTAPSLALARGPVPAAIAGVAGGGLSYLGTKLLPNVIQGDPYENAGAGAFTGLKTRAVTSFTDPVIAKVLGNLAPQATLLARQLAKRTVGGGANVLEDEIISKLDGDQVGSGDRILSFAIGGLISGNDELLDIAKAGFKNRGFSTKEIKRVFNQIDDTIKKDYGQHRLTLPNGKSIIASGDLYANWTRNLDSNGIKYKDDYLGTQGGFADFSKAPELPKQDIDLTKEAQKYKSAEEFIKAQGQPVYHGGEIDDLNKYKVGYGEAGVDRQTTNPLGIYFSDNEKVASEYGSKKIEAILPKNSKILDLTEAKTVGDLWEKIGYKPGFVSPYSTQPDYLLKDMSGGYQMLEDTLHSNPDLLDKIKSEGYSGIRFREMKGDNWFNTTVVFDPKSLLSKSQLIDIWNKANKPTFKAKVEPVIGYRYGKAEGQTGAGTFYNTQSGVDKVPDGQIYKYPNEIKKELSFKNPLKLDDPEVSIDGDFENAPAQFLANKWGLDTTNGKEMERAVAQEAVKRGYDGIIYGDNEIQDLKNVKVELRPTLKAKVEPNRFSVRKLNDAGKVVTENVKGRPVQIANDINAFIHRDIQTGKDWVVSESTTGLQIAQGKTQKEAIANAQEIIKNRPNAKEVIAQQQKYFGVLTQPSLKAKVEPSQKAKLKIQPQEPEVKVKSQLDAKTQSPQGELKVASKSEATPEQVLSDTSRNSPETNLAPTDNIPQNLKNGINTNNLELDTQEKAVLENVIENIKPELEEIKGSTLTNAEVKEAAKRSTILQQVTTREQTKQANAAMLAARQRMVELDSEITKAATEGDTTAVKEKMADLIDSIRVVSSEATDRGRKLQSLSIDAKNASLREKMLKEITKVSDDTAKIVDEASKVDWDNANQVTKFYRKFITPTLAETIDEFRYNNMLSNPRTHLRNAYSNLFQALITRPATIAAGGDVKGAGKYYVGLVKNIPKAIDDFAKSYKGEDFTKKPDLKRVGTNKLPAIITAPSRAMEASDKFFSALIKGGEAARGTDADEAIKIAEYSLFRQGLKPEGQGKVLNQIDNLTSGIYKMGKQFPALRWFVPFVQTPMNVAKQWIEYSPAGFSTMIGASNQKEQAVKAFLGSAATLMAAILAADGRTTWAAPVDSEEKELFYASGKKPYSVKVGDKWVSMQYFGPFAYAMGLPAAYRYHNDESNTALTDSQIDKIGKTITSMTSLLSGQTFLDGLDNFVQLIRGDADYTLPKNLGYTAGQMIPLQGLVRYISTIVDPVYRKSTGFVDQIKSGIPIMSKSLEGYTTPDGELSKREPQNYFTPFDITTAKLKYEKPQEIRATIRQMDKQRTTISNDVDKLNYDELKEAHPERATYYSAEKIYSEINKLPKDDRAGRAAKLQEFRNRGYNTEEINQAIITISKLEKEGMTKTDRELLLFSPDVRAKKIIDRFEGISTKKRKQELLKLYQKYGILDEETQKAIIELGKEK